MAVTLFSVRTWRGNYRRNLRMITTAVHRAAELAGKVPSGGPPYFFEPVGGLAPFHDARITMLLWAAQALEQRSTMSVMPPAMLARPTVSGRVQEADIRIEPATTRQTTTVGE